jgi:hypothetical protein
LINRDGDRLEFRRDGIYMVYFDNARCPACRAYDVFWYSFHTLLGSQLRDTYFVIVFCKWFVSKCDSIAAREIFMKYNVKTSPTTLLLGVVNGEVRIIVRREGVLRIDEIARLIDEFRGRFTVDAKR